MATVTSRPATVESVLMERPYLAWERISLAAALCELGYDDVARAAILDRLRDGAELADLEPWLVESEDLAALEAKLAEGRSKGWIEAYRERGGFLPLPPISGGCEDDDRTVPASAAIVPPELEVLDEVLGPDAPDYEVTRRPGYWEALAADGIDRLPAVESFDPMGPPLPPISGGSGLAVDIADYLVNPTRAAETLPDGTVRMYGGVPVLDDEPWIGGSLDAILDGMEPVIDGPTDADWDRLYEMERDYPPSGGID